MTTKSVEVRQLLVLRFKGWRGIPAQDFGYYSTSTDRDRALVFGRAAVVRFYRKAGKYASPATVAFRAARRIRPGAIAAVPERLLLLTPEQAAAAIRGMVEVAP